MGSFQNKDGIQSQGLDELTDKQKLVLEHLLDHMTSKEIARELRISPHTVDQRIRYARKTLGVESRSELAVEYRRLKEVCDETVYDGSYVAKTAFELDSSEGSNDDYVISAEPPEVYQGLMDGKQGSDFRVAPEWFDGPHGTLVRIGVVLFFAFFLILLGLGGLAVFSVLTELLASRSG